MESRSQASWLKMKSADVEKIIIDLAKQNTPPEKIGLILRDQHGIPKAKVITSKKISQVLKENNFPINSEQENINKKIDGLNKHIENHKHDYTAKRRLTQRLAQVRKFN